VWPCFDPIVFNLAAERRAASAPEVLPLDESFGALDTITRIQMHKEILCIWEKERSKMT